MKRKTILHTTQDTTFTAKVVSSLQPLSQVKPPKPTIGIEIENSPLIINANANAEADVDAVSFQDIIVSNNISCANLQADTAEIADIITDNLACANLVTSRIVSPTAITLVPAADATVNIGNIRYGIATTSNITNAIIKNNRIIHVVSDINLPLDTDLAGLTIIVYNSTKRIIKVRISNSNIVDLAAETGMQFLFVTEIMSWIQIK